MTESKKRIVDFRAFRMIFVIALALLAIVSLAQGMRNAATFSQDFQWDAATALREGINPYDASLESGKADYHGMLGEYYSYYESINAPQRMEANQFPSLLVVLYPYTFLPQRAARIAWLISNLLFTAMICILLRATFLAECDLYTYIVLMLLMICGTPFRNQLGVGQHTLMSFALFLLAVFLAKRDKQNALTVIGTVLALSICYFKYTLTAPLLLWFVYKKKYKEIIASVLLHVALTFTAAFSLGESVIDMIIKPLKVSSALSAEGGLDLGALFGGSSLSFVLGGLIALGLLVLTCCAFKSREDLGNLIFAVALLWSLILTYHRTYDFFVLCAIGFVFADGFASLAGSVVNKSTLGSKLKATLRIGYSVLIISVFFILRIFSESTGSKIVVGAIYYAFTIFVTWILIKKVRTLE